MDIYARDNFIEMLQNELNDRKSLIEEKYQNIQLVKKDNIFLEKVEKDYLSHYDAIKKIKLEQMRSMKILLDYLDYLIKETNMTDETLSHAKKQQSNLLNELDVLNNEINKISKL